MIFKNQELEIGDLVVFESKSIPLPEVQASVIGVENGVLEVLSSFLVPFQHDGRFTENEVIRIMVASPSKIAIPQESGSKKFSKHQSVTAVLQDGRKHQGKVIAAFDGVVVARKDDGQLITGGASFFDVAN